jgi:multicomponent Na+:H+ antiporter subunit F
MARLEAAIALLLLAGGALALVRAWRGPTPGDRIVGVQSLGTSLVGALLLVADLLGERAGRDAALIVVLFLPLAALTVARRLWREGEKPE